MPTRKTVSDVLLYQMYNFDRLIFVAQSVQYDKGESET
jgi:hypothetical protein